MHTWRARVLLWCWVVAVGAVPVGAQSTLNWPVGEFVQYRLESGVYANPARSFETVYRETVTVEGAAWLRLYFDHVVLEGSSFVRITSAKDGEVQELDSAGLAMWNYTSAYFNGDTVYLEIVAGPESGQNYVAMERVAAQARSVDGERGPCADDDCGMCGADNRVPSNEEWSGRIMPVGCSGSVYNMDSCVVSAGHCADEGWDNVIQFNVPASDSDCDTNNPSVADQFPITDHLFLNDGPGADWSVMTTGTNSLGQTIYERYGEYRPIATTLGSSGQSVAVWGYGVDNNDPTRSQTQQTSTGTIGARHTTYYTHSTDVTYGNSGSGLIRNGEIIGIVTHCSFDCDSIATRIDLADFAAARAELCGGPGAYCEAGSDSTSYEHISNVAIGAINNPSGSSGYADYTYLAANMTIGTGYAITVTLDNPYSSDIGGVWVDWNHDQDFDDADETIPTSWSGDGPYTGTITPPAGAPTGSTRMRIRIQDGDYDETLDPCGDTSYGEVEDYTVNVLGPPDTTPPSPDPMTFALPPIPTGASSIQMTATTAIDASPPVKYYFDCVAGGAGGTDSGWQVTTTYIDSDLSANTAYSYRVTAIDSATIPNQTGYSWTLSTATHIETPTGVYFGTPTASTVEITAAGVFTGLTESSSGVYFDSTTSGGDGGINEWLQVTTDTATGLTPNSEYSFRAKARNRNAAETVYSSAASVVTQIEAPAGITVGTVTTEAATLQVTGSLTHLAAGSSGVYFDSMTPSGDGGINEWVQTAYDTALYLEANTAYMFRAKARNRDAVETVYCPVTRVVTLAIQPAAPTLSNPTATSMQVNVNPSGNPAVTEFAIRCLGSADSNWGGKYVSAAGLPVSTAVWQTDADWGTITALNMSPSTAYTFAVKARNLDGVETSFGGSGTLSTAAAPIGACCYADGSCGETAEANCTGTWQGMGSDCSPNPCPQPTGACCDPDGSCSEATAANCTGTWQGMGTDCDPNPCTPPLCAGDMNCDGSVTYDDIDLFVASLNYPGGSGWPYACPWLNGDCDGDDDVNYADIDAFVARIGATCP